MPIPTNDDLRKALGPTLQTATLRAILILAAFAFLGASCTWLFR